MVATLIYDFTEKYIPVDMALTSADYVAYVRYLALGWKIHHNEFSKVYLLAIKNNVVGYSHRACSASSELKPNA